MDHHKLRPADLIDSLRRSVEHIYAGLGRRRGCRPYFCWDLLGGLAEHSFGDMPHVVDRLLDVLGLCDRIFPMPVDEAAIAGLALLMEQSFDRGEGFAWSDVPWGNEKKSGMTATR